VNTIERQSDGAGKKKVDVQRIEMIPVKSSNRFNKFRH